MRYFNRLYRNQQMDRLWNQRCLEAYGEWVDERMARGFQPYLVTFLFEQMLGRENAIKRQMMREVERVYATMLTRIVRNPARHSSSDLPLWIGCPDRPVAKYNQRMSKRSVTVNDGLHMHMVALLPARSRLKETLDHHFEEYQGLYVRRGHALRRVDARPIEQNARYVVGYAFKAINKGTVPYEDLLVLPKAVDEATP